MSLSTRHQPLRISVLLLAMFGLAACVSGPKEPAQPSGETAATVEIAGVGVNDQSGSAAANLDEDAEPTPTTHYVEGEAARERPDADVIFVRAGQLTETTWRFDVTIAHPDKGPDDFADGWDIMLPNGRILGRREGDRFTQTIAAPSVELQPMELTRSEVEIPSGALRVIVRAHDSKTGFGGREVTVVLDQSKGPGFEVSRTY